MKILNNLLQKVNLHNNYLEKVKAKRKNIKDWTNEQLEGYIDSYFNHGLPGLRSFFGETIFGEPTIIEACIEVYGQRVTGDLYKPKN